MAAEETVDDHPKNLVRPLPESVPYDLRNRKHGGLTHLDEWSGVCPFRNTWDGAAVPLGQDGSPAAFLLLLF